VSPTLHAIAGFQLTTADPLRLARFYIEGLGFQAVATPAPISAEEMTLRGVPGGGMRLRLQLGHQHVELETFDRKGRPYPEGASTADLCFQHLAIVTSDIQSAWERARACGADPISRAGPVELPPSSGAVSAVKFRDPEGHPLELLHFPSTASPRWSGTGTLGIDHTAISVGDVRVARSFFTAAGLILGAPTLNRGPEQSELDALDAVEVDVVPMLPAVECPHLELLGYRNPRGRPRPTLVANDIAATRVVWESSIDALLHDPDGHLHLLRRSTSCPVA
jgi:catechol 2,3-dioxygenase-like lactoylglutathione lyase family enzyme